MPNILDNDEEHQLGRLDLSSDGNEVEFIETDDSEANDLSDDEGQVVRTTGRNVRRTSSYQDGRTGRGLPSRAANLSSDSAFSKRFRRTSTAEPARHGTSTNLWTSSSHHGDVDQSVNLMDISQSNPGIASHARPGMASLRSKSLVDIFLTDEAGGDSIDNRSGKVEFNSRGQRKGRSRTCRSWVLVAAVVLLSITFVVVMPDFGWIHQSKKNAEKAPAKAATPSPTKAPTEAPTEAPTKKPKEEKEEEVIEEEEVEVGPPPPKEEAEEEKEGETVEEEAEEEVVAEEFTEGEVEVEGLNLEDVPQDDKFRAMKFFLVDLDIIDEKQLETMGSPAKQALHWISQKDPAKLPVPGFQEIETTSQEAEHAILQRYAMAVFYYSMKVASTINEVRDAGRHLQMEVDQDNFDSFDKSWLSGRSVCKWHGVVCENDDKSVTQINLPGHLLQGTIPRELLIGEAMPYLKQLDLSENDLQGSLPIVTQERDNVGSHLSVTPSTSVLEVLNLEDNLLTGSLDNLVGLTSLREIIVADNHFTGPLPMDSLGALTGLKVLRLESNALSGELPKDVHPLSHLQVLMLSGNEFSGSIPESFGSLMNLKLLYLDGNSLVGEVPTQLGQLMVLQELRLDGNEVTGSLPDEICALKDRKLTDLESDCASDKFSCDCCTECW